MFVCSDDNDDNSDSRLFFLDNEGRITFSVGMPFARPSAGEVGGVEYVSISSDISGCQIYRGRSAVIIGRRSWEVSISFDSQMSLQLYICSLQVFKPRLR